MVELSGKSMNENKTDLLGGIMETTIDLRMGSDVFKSLYAELEEEGSISQADIAGAYLRALILGEKTNVQFYFEVVLKTSLGEVLQKFKDNSDEDVKSLVAFSRENYLLHLRNHAADSKRSVAELLSI
jgi:hypothetical protein